MKHKKRPTIGLALGSGGARGLAHIGVIKALLEAEIPIDLIAGTSAGAVIGGMYAFNKDIYAVESFWNNVNYPELFKMFIDPSVGSGLIKGKRAKAFSESFFGKITIEKLLIPFVAVATDIVTGTTVELKKGVLSDAIRISTSVPLMFEPVKKGKKILVDGGLTQPIPVESARALGADIVIAVNIDSAFFSEKNQYRGEKLPSMRDMAKSTIQLLRYSLAEAGCKDADIVVKPNLPITYLRGWLDSDELIHEGEIAMKAMLPELKKLLA
ncbi:patatin-like phospholipase family protein [Candidatus Dojkabacteria bacterium]|uniref:Patatin-like phospholipase family protein n=1 Tax=Candidatus Dojkabacteria bacterium TaxID=2099670 RepID=A0A955L7F0_9BACT|nr:patatin-like phospholipase family protein [Candidatus Dojkabacteria bacterium]